MRRGHVAIKVIIICRMNTGGKVDGQGRNDMWRQSTVKGLALMYEASKIALEPINEVRIEPGIDTNGSMRTKGRRCVRQCRFECSGWLPSG